MQGLQLKRWLSLTAVITGLMWTSRIGGLRFVPIFQSLTIKAQKNSPPHVAFDEVMSEPKLGLAWTQVSQSFPVSLEINEASLEHFFNRKIVLTEMTIQKSPTRTILSQREISASPPEGRNDWVSELPRAQAQRMQQAQTRSDLLNEDWSIPSWAEKAQQILDKAEISNSANTGSRDRVYVATQDRDGNVKTEVPQAQVTVKKTEPPPGFVEPGPSSVVGHIDIAGGLGYTNDHHIEIRRSDEGVLKELGRVDLLKGLYYIDVEQVTGVVIARLVDKDGKVLGEKSARLMALPSASGKILKGPPITITKVLAYSGSAVDAYSSGYQDKAPANTKATFVKGASEVNVKKDGTVGMDNVMKGSSTVFRVAAPHYLQTTSIIVAGADFKTELFPERMISALQDIVGQQRMLSLNEAPSIIWGKVQRDGKSLAGVEVLVESEPDLQPIYFNQFMLPDPTLKTTGENGLYAFINVSTGYHSLLAVSGEQIIGYQNVVVEEGSVAQGTIVGSSRMETVPLRVYDAFTGEAKSSLVTLQSVEKEVDVENGVATVSLPDVNRVGMMRVQTQDSDYATARYLYNDTDDFIHTPLIRLSWLKGIQAYMKFDDHPSAGYVVGFVPDESFEVYLAGHDNFPARNIVYFDMQGRILQNQKGIAGGGFILYNVPEDVHEIVVIGERTQKMYSRVLPVDANSISVLSFR